MSSKTIDSDFIKKTVASVQAVVLAARAQARVRELLDAQKSHAGRMRVERAYDFRCVDTEEAVRALDKETKND